MPNSFLERVGYTHSALLPLSVAFLLGLLPQTSHAQIRGQPVFQESHYSYDVRLGVDYGHGGEAGGSTISGGLSRILPIGFCHSVSVTAAAGVWNRPGGEFETDLTAGLLATVLLNPIFDPCNGILKSDPLTFRAFVGAGIVDTDLGAVYHAPFGVSAAYLLPIAFARIEPWVTPRVHYRESLLVIGESSWDPAFSVGLNVGLGAMGGVRVALDCCEGGAGGAYGFSLWF